MSLNICDEFNSLKVLFQELQIVATLIQNTDIELTSADGLVARHTEGRMVRRKG
jgi:hypothetical protein